MKILLEFVSEPIISALGWTLVHSVWQGTLLAIFAALFFYFTRKKTASLRYNAGVAILGLQIISTLATLSFYISKIPVASISAGNMPTNAAANLNWQRIEYNLSFTTKMQLWLQAHISELVICWLIGTALLMLRFVGGWIQTEILRAKAKIVMDKEWRTRFGLLSARLNISQEIEFRETNRILTPMVIGAFKPIVLIPVGLLTGFSVSQVEAILAHELAHIRRNDYLVNLLQSIVEVIYFFHPGLWWLSEKVRTERENCCDDIAVNVCGDRISLAHALVKVAELESAPAMAMAFASRKPLLLQRVRRVMGLAPKPVKTFTTLPVMLIALSLVVGISVYAVGQQEKKQTKKTEKSKAVKTVEKFTVSQGTFTDTIIKGNAHKDSPVEIKINDEKDKVESLVEGYHEINPIFSVDDIRKGLSVLNPMEVEILSRQLATINHDDKRMSSDEYEKIRMQIEELRLQMEKFRFDAERAVRGMEKLEWKKNTAMDLRNKLMEKRSAVINPSKPNEPKTDDVEKQLSDFEEQIKLQEEVITKLNIDLIESRKEVFKAEEPMRKIEEEIETLSSKIDRPFEAAMVHGTTMSIAGYPKFAPATPKPPRPPKPVKAKVATVVPNPPKPAKAPTAPPAPPAPPRKK